MSGSGLACIDGDGHVFEDIMAIAERVPKPYGNPQLGKILPLFPSLDGRFRNPAGGLVGVTSAADWMEFMEGMNLAQAVIYPTAALSLGLVQDTGYAVALCQAYNDWAVETFLQQDARLHSMALLPVQDPSAAAVELRRGVTELGMCGGLLPSAMVPMKTYGQSAFDVIWAEAERLDCGLAIHGAPQGGLALESVPNHMMAHVLEHVFPQFMHLTTMVLGGVFERFPRLRVAYLEAATGWVPYLMDKLDTEFEIRGTAAAPECRRLPSEYITSGNVYCSAECGEKGLAYTVTRFPAECILYASDFPHERGLAMYKHELNEFKQRADLSDAVKHAILNTSSRQFYRV